MKTYLILTFVMFGIHWFADFVLQSHEMSTKKSTENKWLLSHTVTYSLVWFAAIAIYICLLPDVINNIINAGLFTVITFVVHTATDYITSREVKRYFDKEDYHNGFVVIGIDQVLHYVQLMLTFYFLFEY